LSTFFPSISPIIAAYYSSITTTYHSTQLKTYNTAYLTANLTAISKTFQSTHFPSNGSTNFKTLKITFF